MKATKLSSVSRALASALILSAAATSRTFAGDGADGTDGAPTNASCCGQTAVAIETCIACNQALAVTGPLVRMNAATLAEAAPRKPRHTVTAFGFVISGNKVSGETGRSDRDTAAFSEIQPSPSWARADAERQPRGLRLFSWSW